MDQEPRQPTDEELEEFLAAKKEQAAATAEAEKVDIPLPEDLAKDIDTDATPAEEARVPVGQDDTFAEDATAARWSSLGTPAKKVTVTPAERDLFFKSVVFDQPLVMDILMRSGALEVKTRMRGVTQLVHERIHEALKIDVASDRITDPGAWSSWFQYYLILFTVEAIDNKGLPVLTESDVENLRGDALADFLRSKAEAGPIKWPESRWQFILSAVRVFKEKQRICDECWVNGDFQEPAGTN